MPVVRMSDVAWDMLKTWATPLEDTVDDALMKVLRIADEHRDCSLQVRAIENGRYTEAKTIPVPKDAQVRDLGTTADTTHSSAQSKRLPRGQKVTNEVFELPILEILYSRGGSAPMREVLDEIEQKIGHLFGPVDHEFTPSGGEIRWRNTAQWARNSLVKRGLLRADSPRGIWELSDEGMAEVEKSR